MFTIFHQKPRSIPTPFITLPIVDWIPCNSSPICIPISP